MSGRRVWIALALGIVAADLSQPLLLEWRPKFVAALVGAVVYAFVAVGAALGRREAAWVAMGMPLIPSGVLALSALGLAPVPVDLPMLLVFGLQCATGLAAWRSQQMGTSLSAPERR